MQKFWKFFNHNIIGGIGRGSKALALGFKNDFIGGIGRYFQSLASGFGQFTSNFKTLEKKEKWRTISEIIINNALYIIILALVIAVTIYNPRFLSVGSAINIVTLSATRLVMALGIAGCIVLTGTDLSAGRILGLAACISASLLQDPTYILKMFPGLSWLAPSLPWLWPVLVLFIVMAVCSIFGLFNGFCVAKFKLHPFIVTLATQLIIYGLILIYVTFGTNKGAPIGGLDNRYTSMILENKFLVPNVVWIAIGAACIMWFVWNKTVFGKNMFAVGCNQEAATVSGVSVFWTITIVFAIAGLMYGFSGFLESARVGSNTAATGFGYEGDAIAACVIGGVSFTGGVGKIKGVIIGVLLIQLINAALVFLEVPGAYTYIVRGAIILTAVAIDMRKYLVKK